MSVLGQRLKQAREDSRYTQIVAAKKLGISNGTLSGYEREYRDPDTEILNKMADLYEVTVEWLMGRTDNKKPKSDNPQLTPKDEIDMSKRMDKMKKDIIEGRANGQALLHKGEPMSEEAMESLLEALEMAERITTLANKKYAPNKYKGKE